MCDAMGAAIQRETVVGGLRTCHRAVGALVIASIICTFAFKAARRLIVQWLLIVMTARGTRPPGGPSGPWPGIAQSRAPSTFGRALVARRMIPGTFASHSPMFRH